MRPEEGQHSIVEIEIDKVSYLATVSRSATFFFGRDNFPHQLYGDFGAVLVAPFLLHGKNDE